MIVAVSWPSLSLFIARSKQKPWRPVTTSGVFPILKSTKDLNSVLKESMKLLHLLFGSCCLAENNPYVPLGKVRLLAGILALGKGDTTCLLPSATGPVACLLSL